MSIGVSMAKDEARWKKYSAEIQLQIVELHDKGWDNAAIACYLAVDYTTVNKLFPTVKTVSIPKITLWQRLLQYCPVNCVWNGFKHS